MDDVSYYDPAHFAIKTIKFTWKKKELIQIQTYHFLYLIGGGMRVRFGVRFSGLVSRFRRFFMKIRMKSGFGDGSNLGFSFEEVVLEENKSDCSTKKE